VTVAAGTRLGPYEILAAIGAGGMGEVYKARDTRLDRTVAIKILPTSLAADPQFRDRFDREARTISQLDHPHICALYDVGEQDGTSFLVMQYLEGETLEARLKKGALPLDQAIRYAIQIADALATAHKAGIVHRDLKPGNIMLTKSGAKLLDFGLAKTGAGVVAAAGLSMMPTTPPNLTAQGTILGTLHYMAPEQLEGQEADARTDIFAFGAVLYEMLTGQRAFDGKGHASLISAIISSNPPPISASQPLTPPVLDRVVKKSLAKDRDARWQTARDLHDELTWIAAERAQPSGVSASSSVVVLAPSTRWRLAVAIGAAIIVAFAVGVLVARPSRTKQAIAATFLTKTFDRKTITNARFMPDGQTIVYSAAPRVGGTPELFVIRPDSEAPQPLAVSRVQLLAVSSKSELAIITDQAIGQRHISGTLARMTLGSAPRSMLEHVREADWSPDGTALAIVHDLRNGRDRLEYPVGAALHEASGQLSDPRVSPDGSRVAFFEHPYPGDDRGWVKVADRSGHVTTLAGEYEGMEGLAWTPDGATILFSATKGGASDLQVMAVPASGRTTAEMALGTPGRFTVYDTTRDGRWLASRDDFQVGVRVRVSGQPGDRDLSWLGSSSFADLSADGEWLLLTDFGWRTGTNYGVVLRRTDGSTTVRLGEGNAQKLSPDGKWALAIISTPPELVIYPTGPGELRRFNRGTVERYQSAEWFSDGRRVLACGAEASRAPRCYVQDVSGSPATPVTPEGVVGRLTPDSRALLLTMPDGTFQLSAIAGGPPQRVDGLRPEDVVIGWSRDSRSMFVQGRADSATVERVDLATGRRTVVEHVVAKGAGLGPADGILVTRWVDEGRSVAYDYLTGGSTLFVVSGATKPR
jgi:Tol biopolymer transport system component